MRPGAGRYPNMRPAQPPVGATSRSRPPRALLTYPPAPRNTATARPAGRPVRRGGINLPIRGNFAGTHRDQGRRARLRPL